jgi:hypothetical protein
LTAEFTLDGPVEIRINGCLDSSSGKREFSHPLHFVTDASTPTAENAFIGISLEKKRVVVRRKLHRLPRIEPLFDPVFIDQFLEVTFPFFFTAGAGHRVVEQNELELQPSRFRNLCRLGQDLHSVFRRGETGWQELRFSFLLDDTETAGAKGNEPSIVAEGWDSYPGGLSRLKNSSAPLNCHLDPINREFDLTCHSLFGTME